MPCGCQSVATVPITKYTPASSWPWLPTPIDHISDQAAGCIHRQSSLRICSNTRQLMAGGEAAEAVAGVVVVHQLAQACPKGLDKEL